MIRTLVAVSALAMAVAPAAMAQDYSQEPNYGSINVTTGFVPDPIVIALASGGDVDASTISPDCNGYISNAPDFRVNYEAGTTFPLIISALSDNDTTLVINGADGQWYCNDDSDGLNPAVTFATPVSRQYDIWVDTYGEAAVYPAGLYISEVTTGAQAAGVSGEGGM